ncbi:MAG: TonB-dependent receptor [Rhodospirillaceae bacterium]|nr:TonB-dependent receptor [Rhodospirillaceae bacterium]
MKRFVTKGFSRLFLLTGAATLGLGTAFGQEEEAGQAVLEEIIVTAERREQALSDVPMAIAAFGQETIEARGYTNLESFFRQVPSVSLLDGGAQRKQVIIRGIAIDAGVRAGGLSSSYVDETLVTGGSFPLDPRMFDMQRVEVLKGPQGTLYGGGSISGSVRYITNKPNADEFQANVAFDTSKTQGSKQGYSFDAMVNIPLVENELAFRGVVFSADNAGYYDNPYLGLTSQGQFDQRGGRLMLQWTPSDTFTATGTYFMDETFQDGWYRASGEDWAAREQINRLAEVLTAEASILALNLEWDVGWATITSATANLDFYSYRKVDRTFLGIDQFWDDARLTVLDDTWDETLSEELRIVSAPDQFGNFDWIAGIFYSDHEPYVEVGDYIGIGDRYDQNNAGDRFVAAAPHQEYVTPFPEGYVSPYGVSEVPGTYPDMIYREISEHPQKQVAFFGELTYNFSDDFSATVGVRDTSTTTSGQFVNQVADAWPDPVFSETVVFPEYTEPHTNYMLNLVYNVNDDVMIFGRAAEGFRVGTGGANPVVQPSCQELARQVLGFTPGPVASDSMWAYEVGTKMTLADGRMVVNAGLYRNEWTDLQVRVRLQGDATCSISFPQNLAAATGNGGEFTLDYLVSDRLQVGLSGSFVDFTVDAGAEFLGANVGDRLPSHPDLTLSGNFDYSFPFIAGWEGFARGEMNYIGEMVGDFVGPGADRIDFGKYTVANLRVGATDGRWEWTVYANNLFNSDGLTFQFRDRRNRVESLVIRPFTLGVNVRTRF